MQETQWIVVTGPPSSGKTTLINMLAENGYIICPEVARELISHISEDKITEAHLDRDGLPLQREILAITLHREHDLNTHQQIFFDRGVPDSIAYFKYYGFPIDDVMRASQFRRYKRIFYCQGLPVVNDDIRQESNANAFEIGQLIINAYALLAYEPIILPITSVENRMQILLDNID